MRQFPPAFTAELNRRDGAAPVWLLRFTAAAIDHLLCQDAITVTPWGLTALPWISSWGELNQGITGTLDDFHVSDLSVTLLNDPDAVPNLRTIAKAKQLKGISMSVYLWFDGCPDPPQELYQFRVNDINLPDEALIEVGLQDESIRYEEYYPGRVLTLADYPYADPDDVGKIIPIAFGTLEKFPTLAIDAGAITTLVNTISATSPTMIVSDASSCYVGMKATIDEETIAVTAINGTTLTISRGVDATVGAIHNRGSAVVEIRPNAFIYQVCDHALRVIPKVWAKVGGRMMDITNIATAYTGQPGDEHPDLPGVAVVTVPGFITIAQAVNLLVNDGIGVSDLITILDGTGLSNTLNFTDTIGVSHTFAISDGKILVDGIDVSDTIGISNLLSILDTIGISDTIAVSDTIAISDALSVGDNIGLSDTTGLTDSININDAGHGHTTGSTTNNTTQGIQQSLPQNASVYRAAQNPSYYTDMITVSFANPGTITASTINLTVSASGGTNRNGTYMWRIIVGTPGGSWYEAYTANTVANSLAVTLPITNQAAMNCHSVMIQVSNDTSYGQTITASITAASRTCTYIVGGTATTSNNAGVGKTGTVSRYGTITKTGAASRSGTISRTGAASKAGSATKTGTAALDGSISRTGAASKTGTVSTTGAIGLTGSVSKTGAASLTGEVTKTGTVTRSGAVAKTGTVTVTGNSVANTLVGEAVYVDLVSDITAPADVVAAVYGKPCQIIGQLPPGYSFNGAITVSRRAPEWSHDLARQCRCWFRFILDTPTLIVRPDALAPVKTISEIRLKNGRLSHSQKLTPMGDVINTINLLYDRDWSKDSGDQNAYRRVYKDKDDVSIDDYGVREKPELFKFDFVTSPAMAASLVAFYLHWYADQRWRHTFEGYIFEAALEFADMVNMAFLEGEVGEVMEAGLNPGRGKDISTVNLTVIE